MHYVALVIGPNPDQQLARYDENLEVAEHTVTCWNCDARPELIESCGCCGGRGTCLSTSNPDGHWDYWRIGGRFAGRLPLKPGAVGELGAKAWEYEDHPDRWAEVNDGTRADQAKAGAVNWAEFNLPYAVVAEGAWRARERYEPSGATIDDRFVQDPHYEDFVRDLVTKLPPDTLVTIIDYHC